MHLLLQRNPLVSQISTGTKTDPVRLFMQLLIKKLTLCQCKNKFKWRLWEPRGSCWDVDTCNGAQTSIKSFTTTTSMYAKCMNMHQNRATIIKPEQKQSESFRNVSNLVQNSASIERQKWLIHLWSVPSGWLLTGRQQGFWSISRGSKLENNGALKKRKKKKLWPSSAWLSPSSSSSSPLTLLTPLHFTASNKSRRNAVRLRLCRVISYRWLGIIKLNTA